MKAVELVIKIPEELYQDIKENGLCGYCSDREIVSKAIANGNVLPKGHGRLIDADKAVREENSKMMDYETTNIRDRSYCRYARAILNDAQTIIEADKAG